MEGEKYSLMHLFCCQTLEGRDVLGDLDIDGTVMLHWICIQTFGIR